jgi:hypothetical protein
VYVTCRLQSTYAARSGRRAGKTNLSYDDKAASPHFKRKKKEEQSLIMMLSPLPIFKKEENINKLRYPVV